MCRKEYIVKLAGLMENESFLLKDLMADENTALVGYLKVALEKNRKAIDDLHQQFKISNLTE